MTLYGVAASCQTSLVCSVSIRSWATDARTCCRVSRFLFACFWLCTATISSSHRHHSSGRLLLILYALKQTPRLTSVLTWKCPAACSGVGWHRRLPVLPRQRALHPGRDGHPDEEAVRLGPMAGCDARGRRVCAAQNSTVQQWRPAPSLGQDWRVCGVRFNPQRAGLAGMHRP